MYKMIGERVESSLTSIILMALLLQGSKASQRKSMSICVAEAETYSSLFTTVKIVNQKILPYREIRTSNLT